MLRWWRLEAALDEPWAEEIVLVTGVTGVRIGYRVTAEADLRDDWARAMRLPEALTIEVELAEHEAGLWPRMEIALISGG